MKKYTFTYPYDKETTMQHILEGTQKSIWYIPKNVNAIFARVSQSGKRIFFIHGAQFFSNAFRPVFVLRFREGANRTIATGYWRWDWFVYVWFGGLLYGLGSGAHSIVLTKDYATVAVLLGVLLFFGAFAGVATWVERKRMKCVIEHLRKYAIKEGAEL